MAGEKERKAQKQYAEGSGRMRLFDVSPHIPDKKAQRREAEKAMRSDCPVTKIKEVGRGPDMRKRFHRR